jgi:hypothetical protein
LIYTYITFRKSLISFDSLYLIKYIFKVINTENNKILKHDNPSIYVSSRILG